MTAARPAATWALLLALPWLEGCDYGYECNLVGLPTHGNFQVTLWVAQPPLPDDLSLVLTGNGDNTVRTLPEIVSDTAQYPTCWLGELADDPFHHSVDAAAPATDRISCGWGGDSGDSVAGTFEATAAGYHDVAIVLVTVLRQECECRCTPIRGRAKVELQPL